MKKIFISLQAILLVACANYPEQPSKVEEITLPCGKVVYQYVIGYSIEDFLNDFKTGEQK